MAKIFLDHDRHGHAQGGRKILQRHDAQILGTLKQTNQAIGQVRRIAGPVELDGEILLVGHLAKVFKVGAHHGHAIGTGEMRHAAATCGRRVGHHQRGCALK